MYQSNAYFLLFSKSNIQIIVSKNPLGVLILWIRNPLLYFGKETPESILGFKNLFPKKQHLAVEWFVVSFLLYQRLTTVTANDGVWHHICLSWEKTLGSWKFFKDGLVKQEGTSFKTGHTIRQGGTLVLGQEQDSVGGDFEKSQSFQGMLSNVHVWDRVLPAPQIKEISTSCVLDEWNEANVYEWSDFLRQGGAMLLKPSPCKPFGTSGS